MADPMIGVNDAVFGLAELGGVLNGSLERGTLSRKRLERLGIECCPGVWLQPRVSYATLRELLLDILCQDGLETMMQDQGSRSHFGIVGRLGVASAMQRDMAQAVRFYLAHGEAIGPRPLHVTMETSAAGGAVMISSPLFLDHELGAVLEVLYAVFATAIARSFGAWVGVHGKMAFHYAVPGLSLSTLSSYFGCPLQIGSDATRGYLNGAWLGSKPLLAQPTGTDEAAAAVAPGVPAYVIAGQVSTPLQLLIAHFPAIRSVDDMARMQGISRRTLNRRLASDGTTFPRLLEEARRRRAVALLHQGKTVDQVAESLEFADARNFRRAFQKWTGRTPSQYRAELHAASPMC